MPKRTPAPFPITRRLTNAERDSYATHLSRLAVELDDHGTRLRTSSDQVAPIAAMRAAMSRAGDLLVALLGYGEIAAPRDLPPWLRWRAEPDAMLEFRGWEGSPPPSRWTPAPDVEHLLRSLPATMQVTWRGCAEPKYGSGVTPIHDRLIFIEAVAGWLGDRCAPPPKLALPTATVITSKKAAEPPGENSMVQVIVDYDGRETLQVALLFMELGPACAMACRHLADALRAAINQPTAAPSTGPDGAVITAYEQTKATWLRRVRCTPKVGDEPARVMVSLGEGISAPSDVSVPLEAESYPRKDGASIVLLLTHPAADALERESIDLADACHDLADLFERRLADGSDARQLAAKLRDLPRCPIPKHWDLLMTIDETVQSMPEPVPQVPANTNDIHKVAVETLDLATRISKLRADHLPEWHAYLTRNTPERFAGCRRQVRSAESALVHLRSDLVGIDGGAMSTRTFMRLYEARQRTQEAGALVEAEVRAELESQIATVTGILQLAQTQVEATQHELSQWTHREKKRWIDQDMQKLRQVLPRYRSLVAMHRLRIAAVADPKSIKLGQLSADYGSGCEALEIFAREVLKERRLPEFNGVDPDQIKIAVEREIALVVSHERLAPPATEKPPAPSPATEPAMADASARPVAPAVHPETYWFHRKGDVWEIRYRGKETTIKSTLGLTYLASLLKQPDKPIHTWALRHGSPPPEALDDEIADPKAIAVAKEALDNATAELTECSDSQARLELEEKISILRGYLQRTERRQGKSGQGRTFRDPRESTRETVGKAIVSAMKAIARLLPDLGRHLIEHIRSPTGMSPAYTPPKDSPVWIVAA